ncbi:MAG TPA: penicillin-binding protein 2 [Candidatus Paceibacterota bacterium]|nr:penicillin-binding protein 2 [Candidatus Paceibacterota bacterium]
MWVNSKKFKVKRKFSEDIETEEILMDSKRLKESPDSEREKLEKPIKENILRIFLVFIVVVLILLFTKSFHLQILNGVYWRNLAEGNRMCSYPIEPLRGIIYDKNKTPLTINIPKLDLAIIPADLIKEANYKEIIKKLSEVIGISEDIIQDKIEQNKEISYPIIVVEDLEKEKAIFLESEFNIISEIKIQKNSRRYYEDGVIFSHILGYIGKVSPKEVKERKYFLDDYIGRTGIEEYYENRLRGTYGEELIEIDNKGKTQKILAVKDPIPGNDLILSVDAELQKVLYQSLKSRLSGMSTSRAAAIAMNPQNGKILALVSFPSFDNNSFIKGNSEYIQKIFQDKNNPLINRVISGRYPPGSTIKPMIASAALEENTINPDKIINCPGLINLFNSSGNIYWTFRDWDTHGAVNMTKAIAESCDVYFYTVGGGYGNQEGLGIDRIKKYLELFGWGEKTGIDLPGEIVGFIPDADWKKETKNQEWFIGDTYNTSIGQGDVLMNPLQLTSAIAVIANNGKLYQPQLTELTQPKLIRENFIKEENLEIVRQGMRETIVSGTAMSLNDLPVEVAGKTGTAEASGMSPHAWFTAFAPYENPEIVITVLIENGAEKGGVSVAVAREILNWYFSK